MVNVCETFESIQGESSYAGLRCFFIRLAGCNLRCKYCDTTNAYAPGKDVPIEELLAESGKSRSPIIEITGGEPLFQSGFRELALKLRDLPGRQVLVETNGSLDISVVPEGVVTIMDVKCPGSGECGSLNQSNIGRLRPYDEIKFVIGDATDYNWAHDFVINKNLVFVSKNIIFSPVFGVMDGKKMGEWILRDALPVRLQVQLHKVLGIK